jgi:hypothetical protein
MGEKKVVGSWIVFGIVQEKSYNIIQKTAHILISQNFSSSKLTCGGL